MINTESIAHILPGTWTLTLLGTTDDKSGTGEYTFKLAGVFDADVRDLYSGRAQWHGYWEFDDQRLILNAQQVDARCASCLGGGLTSHWEIDLEQVSETVLAGTLNREGETCRVRLDRVRSNSQTDGSW